MPKGILDDSIWDEPAAGRGKKEEEKASDGKKEKRKIEKKEKEKKEKGKVKETKAEEKGKKEKKVEGGKAKEKVGEKRVKEKEEGKKTGEKKEVKAGKIDFSRIGRLSSLVFYPLISEKAVKIIESENKLSFIVKKQATKKDIKKLVEETFAVKVKGVKSLNDAQGRKKMIVRLDEKFNAREIATRLGVI